MAPYIRPDTPSASWLNPAELDADRFTFADGKILLGQARDKLVGIDDNRHIVTIAGSRAGKSATSLMSNLLTWNGSVITIDPKGELASNTAHHRAAMGQDVFILDPFNEVKGKAAQYRTAFNPFDELRVSGPVDVVDDAAAIADTMVVANDGKTDHWTLAARNLIRGIMLYALHERPQDASLNDVREILTSPLSKKAKGSDGANMSLEEHFDEMMGAGDAFGGVVAGVGGTMAGKPENEMGSIISTAIEQTAFLDSIPMQGHVGTSGLKSLRVLKHKPTSIYLVLPASRMATHYRWLRVVLNLAMTALEREENKTGKPVLCILEEFPTLGHMQQIEAAAGLMAGYDVKLWTVMQDLSQIQAHYPKSWETFLGNAGIVEAFGNTDSTTLEYLSKRLGNTLAVQKQPDNLSLDARAQGAPQERETIVTVPLMAPYEIALAFNRDKANKLVMLAGEKPFAMRRVFWKDLLNG